MTKEISIIQTWLKQGHKAALAVVAKTWGSAPRRAGSVMVVRGDGVFEGSVSGGCVEGSVITQAVDLINGSNQINTTRAFKSLAFAVASEQAWEVGLACGGEIEIFLYCLSPDDMPAIEDLQANLASRKAVSLALPMQDGPIRNNHGNPKAGKVAPQTTDHHFIVPFVPPVRLDIVGAVHIAQHLAVMAAECDFTARIIDPRGAFSESRTFGSATLYADWPDEYFRANAPDATTAVVTLTHDPKLDDAALRETLSSPAFYIGCLGSRKTHAARVERLKQYSISQQNIDRIHAPVGLNIGSATPAEIAASILAEIIQAARVIA